MINTRLRSLVYWISGLGCVVQVMKTSDQIIIEELKRMVLIQSQEIIRLITKINVPERELSRYTTKRTVTIALCHLLKMRINPVRIRLRKKSPEINY